jgi:4-hydroxybenzoate polyprenyltransferase
VLWVAAGGFPGWHLLAVFGLGTILMRSAGCAVNDIADQDFDRHVQRTAQRPITSGRISTKEALLVAAVLALLAFGLVLTTNGFTIMWSFVALGIAVAYPFAKRVVAMPQAVLGVAFSVGMPMAYAATQGLVPVAVLWWMLGNLAWVLAYDTQYAMVDRADDLNIGIRTSAITLGKFDVLGIGLFYVLAVAAWAHAGWQAQLTWPFYAGLGVAVAQMLWHMGLIRHREPSACFQAFRANHWVGAAVFTGVVLALAW